MSQLRGLAGRGASRQSTTDAGVGYGSAALARASTALQAYDLPAIGARARWTRLRDGVLPLARYHRRLPTVDVKLTATAQGRMIAEHLGIRREEDGRLRYRQAQSVLHLPAEFSEYLRGRHRQAVRTNLGHARRKGFFVVSRCELSWAPGQDDSRAANISPGPVEKWMLLGPDGAVVADSIVSVDADVALLHGLVSFERYARWLLHTAIVERLCGECRLLLVNCDDAYRTAAGVQHFQRLLGYGVARLRMKAPRAHRTTETVHRRAVHPRASVGGAPAN